MFYKNKRDEESNFWLSYADLMAGLLFVFILLIGAIVVKSIVLKSNLESKEDSLTSSMNALVLRDKEVQKLQLLLAKRTNELNTTQERLLITKDSLTLKTQEIQNLNNILLSNNTKIDDFNSKIIILQNLLNEANSTIFSAKKNIDDYKDKVLILSNELTAKEDSLKIKDKKLLDILQALEEKETRHDILVQRLQEQKAKIKSLTGIKIKLISELKESLGKNVQIDSKSGSLRLSSNILFDKDSDTLKESSKTELKKVFIDYIGALISNKNIKEQLDRIVIEGHTDSDGGYLYNLNLSQKRAYAVMTYLLTLDFTKNNNLNPLLVASGRSYLDTIHKNAKEDKELSRRIEIKFTLKNDDAMNEIERILDNE
ncbi:OmpA family protein [bacterium]|nr:OmpA family protein [bacterium]MBU1993392.1 OmpA family protein [bacterium]